MDASLRDSRKTILPKLSLPPRIKPEISANFLVCRRVRQLMRITIRWTTRATMELSGRSGGDGSGVGDVDEN